LRNTVNHIDVKLSLQVELSKDADKNLNVYIQHLVICTSSQNAVRDVCCSKGKGRHTPLERIADGRSSLFHRLCTQHMARLTVTFPAAERHRPMTGTKLYCLVTGGQGCEQLAQSRYAATPRPGVKPATSLSQLRRPNRVNCAGTSPRLFYYCINIVLMNLYAVQKSKKFSIVFTARAMLALQALY